MWALRRASVPLRSQAFSTVAFRACSATFEIASSSDIDKTGFGKPPPEAKYFTRAYGAHNSFSGKHSFSSQAGTKSSGEEDDDLKDGFSELESSEGTNLVHESEDELISETEEEDEDIGTELEISDAEEEVTNKSRQQQRASSGLFKAALSSQSGPVEKALDKWLEEGNALTRSEISLAMLELRWRRMYGKALQLSEWLESQEGVEFGERDYASRVDLIAKMRGLEKAETYIEKIPESFRGEVVYRTLLANCVHYSHSKKAEQVFNKMKDLKFPITTFACNQLLLLYKKIDMKKVADVLLLMENENVKPSLFTYRILMDIKGRSNDISGMEQVLERLKADGLEPDLRIHAVLARHYVSGGSKEKAKAVLKEMEGSSLQENRRVCSSLFPIYAALGSAEDVKRVWEVCESNPRLLECLNAIDAWGKLKKVEKAEAVFDVMSKKVKKLSTKHYTAMLKVYANSKMLSKGKDIVKRMEESGCWIGPWTWDAIIKLYIEAGELEKADSILNKVSQQKQTRPLFYTYMMILDGYAKRGDVHNTEKTFYRMRQDGYVSRISQYHLLLKSYINAKVPAYGFRERMKADNVYANKSLAWQLDQMDPFKKRAVSDLLD